LPQPVRRHSMPFVQIDPGERAARKVIVTSIVAVASE
jgi:hypothetical protein